MNRNVLQLAMVIIVTWALPLTLLSVFFRAPASIEESDIRPDQSLTTVVGGRDLTLKQSVRLTAEVAPAESIKSPVSGTVSRHLLTPGSQVKVGDSIIEVNGLEIVAYRSEVALFRELKLGSNGNDVVALNTLLEAMNFESSAEDATEFTQATRTGVRSLQQQIGISQLDGVFRPSYTALVPKGFDIVEEVAELGTVTSVGDELATSTFRVVSVEFKPEGNPATFVLLRGRPVLVTAGEIVIPLAGLQLEASAVNDIRPLLEDSISAGEPMGKITVSALSVELSTPESVGAVPSSALTTSLDSEDLCMSLATAAGPTSFTAVKVSEIPSNEAGITYVDAQYVGRTVAIDAARAAVGASC